MDHIGRNDIHELSIGRRSAAPVPWRIVAARSMTREDMVLILAPNGGSDPRAPLAKISAPHHTLARLIAQGKEVVEVSNITGYTPERIRTLQRDPAFSELVSHYETEEIRATADVAQQIQHIALSAAQRIQEKLDDPDHGFTIKDLRELMVAGLDRTGHGPTSKKEVTINDPTGVINSLQGIIQSEGRGRVLARTEIVAEYTEVTNVSPAPRTGAQESDPGAEGPVANTDESEGPGGPGPSVPEESRVGIEVQP